MVQGSATTRACRFHGYCPNQSSHARRPQHRPIAAQTNKLKRQDAGEPRSNEADADGDCRDDPDQRAEHPAREVGTRDHERGRAAHGASAERGREQWRPDQRFERTTPPHDWAIERALQPGATCIASTTPSDAMRSAFRAGTIMAAYLPQGWIDQVVVPMQAHPGLRQVARREPGARPMSIRGCSRRSSPRRRGPCRAAWPWRCRPPCRPRPRAKRTGRAAPRAASD